MSCLPNDVDQVTLTHHHQSQDNQLKNTVIISPAGIVEV